MKKTNKKISLLLMLYMLLLLAVPAIASSVEVKDENLPTIRVVHDRGIDNIGLYVGVEEGFFKDAGINVELLVVKGEQNKLAGVMRGDIDCGEISLSSLYKLTEQDLPVKVVVWNGHAHEKTKCGIHVGSESKYETLKDIKGLRIATSGSIAAKTLLTRAAKLGGYELADLRPLWGGRPDNPMQHEAALRSGGVDAFIV
ncbi:MAG: ABC transporter substrate-binding protein [Desulforhopalus sp.]